jgi:hypothetical protein
MRAVLAQVQDISQFANEFLWLGGQILKFGGRHERVEGVDQVISAIVAGATEPLEAVEMFCEHATGKEEYEGKLCDGIRAVQNGAVARLLLRAVKDKLSNDQFLFTVGRPVVNALALAREHSESAEERKELQAVHKRAATLVK